MLVLLNTCTVQCWYCWILILFSAGTVECWYCWMLVLLNTVCSMLVFFSAGTVQCWYCWILILFSAGTVECWYCSMLVLLNADTVECWYCWCHNRIFYGRTERKSGILRRGLLGFCLTTCSLLWDRSELRWCFGIELLCFTFIHHVRAMSSP
jgi:hypothetical protein